MLNFVNGFAWLVFGAVHVYNGNFTEGGMCLAIGYLYTEVERARRGHG